ncbi:MAG: multifunctional oxoglutarate decarboxylase/oxoglutarate dehydrogenase thiamine pyrophosphate-binding subunit/dihydrolipoyllysine-residue succinyltransferase subunit [Actinomycetota bacterium]|nr:multifunctional oxoglutarate decarboxylase/oxoglutarate dehydrogenase thiamine pyrophosphate-binding subunit/dihydrolipoyllysine-residue succinyltransferase subunit [Actinomycetota bacterium]
MQDDQHSGNGAETRDDSLGLNAWLVEEMYQTFVADPNSVNEGWREFFSDYRAPSSHAAVATPALPEVTAPPAPSGAPPAVERAPSPPRATPSPPSPANGTAVPLPAPGGAAKASPSAQAPATVGEAATPLRGVAARVVENMTTSLGVPTATSVHPVPARLLEVNRRLLNEHLATSWGGKISFTHLIAWAIVRALRDVRALNASFVDEVDGKPGPGVVRHAHVSLGIAVDVERPSGERSLVVPVLRSADELDFAGFHRAYEQLIHRARTNRLEVSDFVGATVTITNPGTLGTTQSVPRLMAGQGAIIGVGALAYPAEYAGADPATLTELGIGRVVTLTSTYDHRVIQGADSGRFLQRVHELLVGEDGFYDEVFSSLAVPHEPARWRNDTAGGLSVEERDRVRVEKTVQLHALINMYRVRGHLIAHLDPLSSTPPEMPSYLDPEYYGLTLWDLDRTFYVRDFTDKHALSLSRVLEILREAYCRRVGVEYMHIQDIERRQWIQHHVEGVDTTLEPGEQQHILGRLNAAEAFERFLHTRYVGQRRFGLEGAESTIPFLDACLEVAAGLGVSEVVLGMAHRGRLNVLANIVGKSYNEIFAEFEGNLDPDTVQGSGDVKYHKGAVGKWQGRHGEVLSVALASNPSHLEAVDPVVEGMVRAKQARYPNPEDFPVLPILVHGDAAFAGQGVVAETLNLSQLRGYRTGGTVHLVINNQLGFTTPPTEARSSVYATDVAKMVQAPIFHVNGDDPEACVRVARLAAAWRQRFRSDVVVDLVCYRLHGHNEGDDPSYTQPLMYKEIDGHRSVRKLYTESLVRRGDITLDEAEQALADFVARLQGALDETRSSAPPKVERLTGRHLAEAPRLSMATGVDRGRLDAISRRIHSVPDGFVVHPKLARQFAQRYDAYRAGEVDWALGEGLALGSLLLDGVEVRLSGQDSRRGTFSQRHAVLVDYETGVEHVALAHLAEEVGGDAPVGEPGRTGGFSVLDSLLSEYAALGFEYGYSVEAKQAFVCWEAQFGDFANGAQIIIDNFLVASEEKWAQRSGLVLLLPHGFEGQGAEHSSARLERYLTLAADNNITVAQPTTAAQYFHLLRAQARREIQRPLIVMTPKSLLRSRSARSSVDELANGHFFEVLDDPGRNKRFDAAEVTKVICCSGKVGYDAIARRDALLEAGDAAGRAAIVRIEQLYPWPEAQLVDVLDRYSNATELVFLQEEPENMGAWNFAHGRLHRLFRNRYQLKHVSRGATGSPATGSHMVHELEHGALLAAALAPEPAAS